MIWTAVRRRFWPAEFIALCVALAGALGLLVVARTVPAYTVSESGSVAEDGPMPATLVAVNGPGVLLVTAVPLAIVLAVAALMWRRGLSRGPGVLPWIAVGLLAALTLVGMLSIGPAMVPTLAGVAVACGVRQGRRSG